MRTWYAPVVLVGIVTAWSMAAVAAPGIEVTLDFTTPAKLEMTLDWTMSGEEASQFRQGIDQNGDGDGTVTAAEVSAFEAQLREEAEAEEDDESMAENLTVDGKASTGGSLGKVDLRDAEGPAESTGPLVFQVSFLADFPVTPGDQHVIRMSGIDEESEDDDLSFDEAILKVPSGYVIKSTTTLPQGASLSADKKQIRFTEETDPNVEFLEITIQKESVPGETKGGGAPAIPVALALAAVLAVVFVRRGRVMRP